MAKKRKSNKAIYILLGLVVALVVFIIIGKSAGFIGKTKEIEVEVNKAKSEKIIDKVSASGMIQPVYEVKISPDVSGEIIDLNIEEGDSVKRGDLLIKIRPDIYQSALEQRKATLNQQIANMADARARASRAKAQLVRAKADYNRNKELKADKVISDSDFELAEANYKVAVNDVESAEQNVVAAQAMVDNARASVDQAEENLRFTSITAPVTGIVSKLDVELGERVVGTSQMAGTEMLRIADLTKMEARVDVNENDIIRVSLRDTAIIDVDSYTHTGKKFKGIVTNIANTANDKLSPDAVTEFEVRILLLNESYKDLLEEQKSVSPFRPGMTTSVDIITDVKDDVLTVPLSAVTTRVPSKEETEENEEEESGEVAESSEDRGDAEDESDEEKEVVFVFEEGKAKMIEVETGISDFDNIEIVSGIEAGAEIITGPFVVVSKRLKDGDLVKTKEEDKKKKG
jgi:HlyD family secretion protein